MVATVPQNEPQRRLWVRAQLTLRGITLGQLARNEGLERTTIKTALHRRYPRAEAVIARALEMRPQDIWADRYTADGKPLNKRRTAAPKADAARGGAR